jgi:phosphopantothenoylcysteine synthetase/decarboxylase
MYNACVAAWPQHDIAILCAAVADFAPEHVADNKIKKENLSTLNSQPDGFFQNLTLSNNRALQG